MPPADQRNLQAALWMLASVAGATGMTVGVRLLTPEIHSAMLAFLRSAFAVLLVVPFVWQARRRGNAFRFTAWRLHLARGLLIAAALNAGFYAIWHLPMATATILFFMAPVFATMLAIPILGERVGARRWAAVGAAFLGAAIILRPGVGDWDWAMAIAILSSMCFAVTLSIGRLASDADGSGAVFVSSSVVPAIATLPPALLVWELPAEGWRWVALGGLVVASALRGYADIRAYAVGEAGFLAPFSYLRLIGIGLIGWLFFAERIDGATLLGGAIIIAATLFISLREARLGRRGAPKAP